MQFFKSVQELPPFLKAKALMTEKTISENLAMISCVLRARQPGQHNQFPAKNFFHRSHFHARLESETAYRGNTPLPAKKLSALWIHPLVENDNQTYSDFYTGRLTLCLAHQVSVEYFDNDLVLRYEAHEIDVGYWGDRKQHRVHCYPGVQPIMNKSVLADVCQELETVLDRLHLEKIVSEYHKEQHARYEI